MKIKCPKCGNWKNEEAFNISRTQATGRQSYCKECHRLYKIDNRRNLHLRYTYGLTQEEIDELAQECEICGSKKRLCVDHNANFGFVRGVLCNNCNFAIGLLREDPDLMKKAIEYLERTN